MDGNTKNIYNNIQLPVCVVLPFCVEQEIDVFLNILRSVVARSRLDDDDVEGLRAGMTGDMFYVKQNDLSANWKELGSKSQRIRQYKLLGFWASRNFPTLGKKLMGEVWQPPQGKIVEVIGSPMMSADVIDAVIVRKMQLRLVELNVCQSTIKKLKHFVTTPISIGKFNEIKISTNIKCFEIGNDYIERCWEALKFGQFSMNHQPICLSNGRTKTMEQERGTSSANTDSQLEPVTELSRVDVDATNRTIIEKQDRVVSNRNGAQLVPVVKRARLEATIRAEEQEQGISSANDSQLMYAAENDANTREVSNIESFQMALLEMKKVIADITKSSNPGDHHVEVSQLILKQKDEELAQMKVAVENLRNENNILNGHIERSTSLANALQKGVESSSKLYEMLDSSSRRQIRDYMEKLNEVEKVKLELTEKNVKMKKELNDLKHFAASIPSSFENQITNLSENAKLQKELDDAGRVNVQMSKENAKLLKELNDTGRVNVQMSEENAKLLKELDDTGRVNVQMSEENAKLQKELDLAKNYAATVEPPLENRIQDLMTNLSEAGRVNLQMQQELEYWKNYAVIKENELIEAKKVEVELDDAGKVNVQMSEENAKLLKELNDTGRVNVQMSEENAKLQKELDLAKNYAATVEPPLQNRIQDLMTNLSEAGRVNFQMQQELEYWKNYAVIKENELIEAKKVEVELDDAGKVNVQMSEENLKLLKELDDTGRVNVQMSEENAKLQKELDLAKNYAGTIEPPLQNRIQDLMTNLSEAGRVNLQMQQELEYWKNYAVIKENELIEAKKVEVELNSLKSSANTIMAEIQNQIQNLEKNESESKGALDETEEQQLFPDCANTKEILLESVQTSEVNSTEENHENVHLSTGQIGESLWEPEFETDDPIILQCRGKLKQLPFHWIKFSELKNARFSPGFVHPAEPGKKPEAQILTHDGYVTSKKYEFIGLKDNIEEIERTQHKTAFYNLNKFNKKFKSNFK